MIRFLFSFNLFLGAFLLFSIQPMAAKVLLPHYGGAPEIWTVCMLFFQGILLAAYGYVSMFPKIKSIKCWSLMHLTLIGLSLLTIPILFQPSTLSVQPEQNILYNLLIQLGLPLLVVGASAPLLQFLYSQTTNKGASDPYFLYSASNWGSLIALLTYPWLIEQYIALNYQFHIWNVLYLVYIIGLLGMFIFIRFTPLTLIKKQVKRRPWRTMLYWFGLSFTPCSLMLGVSLYITTDVSATPLFWIVPLVLYLTSFILTFSNKPLISSDWLNRNVLWAAAFVIYSFILGNKQNALQIMLFNLAGFFMIALACHSQLYKRRPVVHELTQFYFCLALGGVSAGIINGVIAPHVFNQIYEYPIAILLSILVIPIGKSKLCLWSTPVVILLLIASYFLSEFKIHILNSYELFAIIAVTVAFLGYKNKVDLAVSLALILCFIFLPKDEWHVLAQERNFYGVKRVIEKENLHVLINQSTAHGLQYMNDESPFNGNSSYYATVKEVINLMQQAHTSLTTTIIGLGTGTSLCQYRHNDKVTMIEIDPQVIAIANNSTFFTYMRDCLPQIHLVNDDGRMAVYKLNNASQDIIVLDAFSSDAVPIHLMTLEAFTQYKQKLAANGIILVNLSNRYLNLLPVVNAMGRSLDMMVFYNSHKGDAKEKQFDSQWALLTNNESLLPSLTKESWRFLASNQHLLWTDNYSNIIPLLRWS